MQHGEISSEALPLIAVDLGVFVTVGEPRKPAFSAVRTILGGFLRTPPQEPERPVSVNHFFVDSARAMFGRFRFQVLVDMSSPCGSIPRDTLEMFFLKGFEAHFILGRNDLAEFSALTPAVRIVSNLWEQYGVPADGRVFAYEHPQSAVTAFRGVLFA